MWSHTLNAFQLDLCALAHSQLAVQEGRWCCCWFWWPCRDGSICLLCPTFPRTCSCLGRTGTAAELVNLGKLYWAGGSVYSCKSGQHVGILFCKTFLLKWWIYGNKAEGQQLWQRRSVPGKCCGQWASCTPGVSPLRRQHSSPLVHIFTFIFWFFLMFIPCKLERDKRYPVVILKPMRSGHRCLNVPPVESTWLCSCSPVSLVSRADSWPSNAAQLHLFIILYIHRHQCSGYIKLQEPWWKKGDF